MTGKKVVPPTNLTPAVDEGPYYKAGSPSNAKFDMPGVPGERLVLSGRVFDAQGKPVAGAWLDFWQADGEGHYDNAGFKLRGHQLADSEGLYRLETVMPGSYPGRTPHIHVKVRAGAGSPVFTTQLFIPGLPSNLTDFLYLDALQMEIKDSPTGKTARFDFRIVS
jgi:protocatechuate 3,4-dioxygenase beta subunit